MFGRFHQNQYSLLSATATITVLSIFATSYMPCVAQIEAAPAFEVASVRQSQDCTGFSMTPPGERLFTIKNVSMAFLIGMAYGVGNDQIVKDPSWIESECYAISARASGEGKLSNDQLKLMLQDLLMQRFHLTLHHETKELRGYVLVIGKDGPRLETSKGGAATGRIGMDGLHAQNMPLGAFVKLLTHPARAHVVDGTMLTGRYDIDLSFANDSSEATTGSSPLPSLFTAVQEQLGLKLVPKEVPVDMLVIDHVEKVPVEN